MGRRGAFPVEEIIDAEARGHERWRHVWGIRTWVWWALEYVVRRPVRGGEKLNEVVKVIEG